MVFDCDIKESLSGMDEIPPSINDLAFSLNVKRSTCDHENADWVEAGDANSVDDASHRSIETRVELLSLD